MTIESLKYHIHPERMEKLPLDWQEVFSRSAPIWVEIGFGNGEYLTRLAEIHPEVNFVGFELSLTSFVKCQKKLYDKGIDNVRVVMVDGRFGLRELFADETVERVIVNFPCPWSKKRHEKRRITAGDFIQALGAVLVRNGRFELMTDDENYAREVHEKLLESGYFKAFPITVDLEREVTTRYERKWKEMGRHTYFIAAEKIKKAKVERLTWEGEDVHVKIEKVSEERIKNLQGKVFKGKKDRVFIVKEVYKSSHRDSFFLKVISSDKGFNQNYGVTVERRKNGWIVALDSISLPYRTPAVKWSVREIARRISKSAE